MATVTGKAKDGAVDLAAVGKRIVALRHARGLSQKQLAQQATTDNGHLSRIERGLSAASPPALARIAHVLGCPVEHLTHDAAWPGDPRAMDLQLNFAELALRSGDDPASARAAFTTALERARETGDHARAAVALYGLSMAQDSLGELEAALEGFQRLADLPDLPPLVDRSAVLMMLARTCMALGDLHRAIDIGEAALAERRLSQAPTGDKAIELASTVALCYYERGDIARAHLLVRETIAAAETNGSAKARGSAYWNAAYVEQARGNIDAAVRLTERAIALLGEEQDRWATATLRRNAGWLLLQTADPDEAEVRQHLERAHAELQQVGRPSDIAEVEADLARFHLLTGDSDQAAAFAEAAVERTDAMNGPVLEHAKAQLVLAEVKAARGDTDAAEELCRCAATDLEQVEASWHAAVAWRQAGELLMRLGRYKEAAEALQRVADARGVRRPAPATPWVRALS